MLATLGLKPRSFDGRRAIGGWRWLPLPQIAFDGAQLRKGMTVTAASPSIEGSHGSQNQQLVFCLWSTPGPLEIGSTAAGYLRDGKRGQAVLDFSKKRVVI